jgi:hypothetical protein
MVNLPDSTTPPDKGRTPHPCEEIQGHIVNAPR